MITDPAVSKRTKLLALLLCGALSACADMPRFFKPADPLSADQHFRLGAALEADGRPDEALRQYQRVVRLDAANPEGWIALGNLLYKRGDYQRAEYDYQRALNVSPSHVGAQNNLAMTYLAQNKKLKEAERLAEAALRQESPLQPYVLATLADIYAAEGRVTEARATAAQAAAAATSRGITLPAPPENL
jgi:tetratricopeptide (TPR) repeat protein